MCWVLPEWREPSRTMSFVPWAISATRLQDEGAHEDLAQLRVALHEGAQIVPIDGDDRSVARDARPHQAAPRRQHVDLAGELARAVHDDRLLAIADRPHDVDRARQHDEEPRVLVAHVEEHLARAHVAAMPDARDAIDLRRRELGKHLRGAFDRFGCHGLGPTPCCALGLARLVVPSS